MIIPKAYLFNAIASANVSGIFLFIVSGSNNAINPLAIIMAPNTTNGKALPKALGMSNPCNQYKI